MHMHMRMHMRMYCLSWPLRALSVLSRGARRRPSGRTPLVVVVPCDAAMPKLRGTDFARYLRKVHVEWCPFKPKALGPIFFQELHAPPILQAVPKMTISKALLRKPADDAAFVDRTHITFADGETKTYDFSVITKMVDIMDEIHTENVRIQALERERGRPFS